MTVRFGMICAALVVFASETPATAHDWTRGEVREIAVPSIGLDLSSEAGIDLLSARIGRAVRDICGRDRWCEDEAWASTQWQVAQAIARARHWRRLAEERAAQVRACHRRCAQPAAWVPPPPATTVIVIRH